MKIYRHLFVLTVLALSAIVTFSFFASRASMQSAPTAAAREDAYRANNLGVALLEQFKYKEAADAFRRALKIDPQLAMARINLAIALYNVPDLVGAQREAEAAPKLAPKAPQPHYILGRLAKDQNRLDDAVAALQRVVAIDPRDTGANILLGQVYAQQRKYPEAITLFRTAYAAEPYNGTALYSLGTAMLRGGDREEGQRLIQRFKELRESGAATSIGNNYLEQGRYAEAITSTGAEPELVDKKIPDVTFVDATASVLPGGAAGAAARNEASSGSALGRTFKATDFNDAAKNELVSSLAGGVTLFDFDNDGDLDLFEVTATGQKLYRNDGGKFVDVTAQSGALGKQASGVGIGAVAGDFDNDEKPDLFVLRYGSISLYRNEGDGRFTDVTAAAKIPAYPHLSISAAFVDADHDGDLDIFVAGLADLAKPPRAGANELTFPQDFAGAPNMLLRNNGNGTFVDYTAQSKVAGSENNHAVAVVPTDYDNRRDVDLLLANFCAAPTLYRNLRDSTFRNVAAEVDLNVGANYSSVAVGDVNKDGFTDFYFGQGVRTGCETTSEKTHRVGGVLALSDGKGAFNSFVKGPVPSGGVNAAQFLDYDNDGLLDLVVAQTDGIYVWRNVGSGWQKASDAPLWKANLARSFASGDMDGDGDVDLIARSASGQTLVGRNEGGNRNRSVRVRLTGKVSNRSGVASKIEARAGSLQQKLETYSATPAPAPADVVFGLGQRQTTDAVRVIWPAGIVQAETEITPPSTAARAADTKLPAAPVAPTLNVIELDRKPSSCPYLFAWNGERFEFITDFMGGGELGYWVAPGVRAAPDPDEYVRIRGDQLKARNGRFEIRVTNELEEALFMDRLQLLAIAHPEGVEVYPNEGLGNPTSATFKLYATRGARLPIAATDDKGQDVLDRIRSVDRKYPDNFRLHRIRGYADEH
ncbi:MAG: FG-GAP-like repeat-containing protein, partial [Acidobacteriota bacterium]|nr:FG-GAP-like repeat-containing protein [Acidobacteriota bacterium]